MLITFDTHLESTLTVERGSNTTIRLQVGTANGTTGTLYLSRLEAERLAGDLISLMTDDQEMSPRFASHLIYLLARCADDPMEGE